MDHTWWVVSMSKEFRWRNEPGGQKRWKRRWLRHLGKRCAFPTFPPLRRRRGLSLDLESGHFTCYKNRTSSRANNTCANNTCQTTHVKQHRVYEIKVGSCF